MTNNPKAAAPNPLTRTVLKLMVAADSSRRPLHRMIAIAALLGVIAAFGGLGYLLAAVVGARG